MDSERGSGGSPEKDPGGNAASREHVRTEDCVPVYYGVLDGSSEIKPPEGWETLFEEIEPGPEENTKLYELLFDMNNKLNILLDYISTRHDFRIPRARNVNISGGGLQFYCFDKFKMGDLIAMKIFLPTYAHTVSVKGEVVRVAPREDGGYDVAVKYVGMDEATRDKIIRYVFARQRKVLRTEKTSDPEK